MLEILCFTDVKKFQKQFHGKIRQSTYAAARAKMLLCGEEVILYQKQGFLCISSTHIWPS